MARSPERISSGVAGAAAARRPMASRSRASTSAGPAPCRITSSAPQSAVTAASPPSVRMASSGVSRLAVRSSRHRFLAWTRSRRASTRMASAGGASPGGGTSAGANAHRVQQQAQGGQDLGGGLQGAGEQQQVAHVLPPPPCGLLREKLPMNTHKDPSAALPGSGVSENSGHGHSDVALLGCGEAGRGSCRGDPQRGHPRRRARGRIAGPRAGGGQRPGGPPAALRSVLARSSFLVDGNPVGGRAPEAVLLEDAAVVEVLPPFAGG